MSARDDYDEVPVWLITVVAICMLYLVSPLAGWACGLLYLGVLANVRMHNKINQMLEEENDNP